MTRGGIRKAADFASRSKINPGFGRGAWLGFGSRWLESLFLLANRQANECGSGVLPSTRGEFLNAPSRVGFCLSPFVFLGGVAPGGREF